MLRTIPVRAGKPLTPKRVRGNFNDYPFGESLQEYGVKLDVGENPLNGKGAPLNKGEEIV